MLFFVTENMKIVENHYQGLLWMICLTEAFNNVLQIFYNQNKTTGLNQAFNNAHFHTLSALPKALPRNSFSATRSLLSALTICRTTNSSVSWRYPLSLMIWNCPSIVLSSLISSRIVFIIWKNMILHQDENWNIILLMVYDLNRLHFTNVMKSDPRFSTVVFPTPWAPNKKTVVDTPNLIVWYTEFRTVSLSDSYPSNFMHTILSWMYLRKLPIVPGSETDYNFRRQCL